jgi:hypothetical protein
MDRFPIESAADLAGNYARHMARIWGEDVDAPYHPDGPICQNCDRVVDRITLVPEFNYLGCDECMEEALRVIAHEEAFDDAIMAALATGPKCIVGLSEAVRAVVKVTFVDVCTRVGELVLNGRIAAERIDGEEIYSLSATKVQPGSVVWNDIQREVA